MGPLVKDRSRGCQISQTSISKKHDFPQNARLTDATDRIPVPALRHVACEVVIMLKQAVHQGFVGVSAGG